MTVACWGLRFGTIVEFHYNGRVARGVVTDYGPALRTGRKFDLSEALFDTLTEGRSDLGIIPVAYCIVENHEPNTHAHLP
jgi:hypothetical protein